MTDRLLVLFDADCGICTATARWLGSRDRRGALELLPLQTAAGDDRPRVRELAASHPLHDELHVIDPSTGAVRSGGAAFIEIVGRLPGGRWPARLAALAPATWAIGLGYALVARNRRAISRALRLDTVCAVPGPRS